MSWAGYSPAFAPQYGQERAFGQRSLEAGAGRSGKGTGRTSAAPAALLFTCFLSLQLHGQGHMPLAQGSILPALLIHLAPLWRLCSFIT